MSEGGFSGGLFASNVTQMAVISDWNGSYGSMRPRGHVRHLDFGDGGMPSAQCVQNSRWRGSFFFGLKSPCLRGVPQHVHGLQCRSSDCNFRLEQFVWNNGTKGICPTPRFGDGVHARCSMGPSRSLERVFFSLKIPMSEGAQRHILGL